MAFRGLSAVVPSAIAAAMGTLFGFFKNEF